MLRMAEPLRAVERWLVRQAGRARRRRLSDCEVAPSTGLAPAGFHFAEAWAVVLDSVARRHLNPGGVADGAGIDVPGADVLAATVEHLDSEVETELASGTWPEVRVGRLPLVRSAPGGLGRSRRPADRGRAPRRVHRLLTDPHRRVFDQYRRSNGGVVLIDGSGSMQLGVQDVRTILEAAPGATVAIYACGTGEEPENLWVLAEQGRMADRIPERPAGNGVDAPAAEWAVRSRQHPRAPVVWITDGWVSPEIGRAHV